MKIRKILTAILVFVIASGMLCSCMGKPQKKAKLDDYDPDSVEPAEVSVDYSEVEGYDVEDNTEENYEEFAFNMFNRCAEDANDENMMISPASMLFALVMTAGGARNNTLTEMADTLCPGSTPEEMQAFSLYYMNQLMGMSEEQLNVANAVWVNDDRIRSDLNEDYADFVEDQYHGEITRESFGPSTVNHINDWVDDVTDGMIDRVIEEITDDCALVLVNAITFDCDGGEFASGVVAPVSYLEGNEVELPVPTKRGYEFKGWYDNAAFTGDPITQITSESDILLNDAVTIPQVDIKQVPIIKGDAKSISIGAASIIAKVTRDRLMVQYNEVFPQYDFASNKGYGTAAHIEALKKYGPCPIHRRSFIKNFCGEE